MDNKALLYIYANALKFSKKRNVITPGLGSIYIGPFLKSLHGYDYTNVLLSLYVVDNIRNTEVRERELGEITSNDLYLQADEPILVLDDNMGTGKTLSILSDKIRAIGKKIIQGAIQYNWHNYKRVEIGEKNIDRFDPRSIDLLTPFDYPGHKLLKGSVNALKISGKDYIEFMKNCGYRKDDVNDFENMIQNGEENASFCDVDLYGDGLLGITPKKTAIAFNNILKSQINELDCRHFSVSNERKTRSEDDRIS